MTSFSPGLLAGMAKKDPPHTRQSPRTLAAFRPWGGWRDERRARGLPASLSVAGRPRDPVAHAWRSGNDLRLAKLSAQAADRDRHRIGERGSMLVPQPLQQGLGPQEGGC